MVLALVRVTVMGTADVDWTLSIHIIIVLCYVIIGGFENFVIIFMLQRKQSLLSGQKYLLFLAYVDLFACVYCVPMIPCYIYLFGRSATLDQLLLHLYRVPCSTQLVLYMVIAVSMAIDRLRATVSPFSYKPPKMTSFIWLILYTVVFVALLYLGVTGVIPVEVMKVQVIVFFSLVFLICSISYTVVAITVRQKRKRVTARPTNESRTAVAKKRNEDEIASRMLKLCVGITLLLALSLTAAGFKVAFDMSQSVMYIYSLNHVGNPIIYCAVNKAYYRDVKEAVDKIVSVVRGKLCMLRINSHQDVQATQRGDAEV